MAPKEVPIPEERAVVGRGWGLTEGCHGRGFRGNVGGGGGWRRAHVPSASVRGAPASREMQALKGGCRQGGGRKNED